MNTFGCYHKFSCEKLRRGFTLVELLVVISIIALLLAILMPSLNKAREQGRNIVCMSNLRQMGVAWILYWEDNDYRLYDEYWYWWKPIIKHQKGSADILSCPSMYMYGWFDDTTNWTGSYGNRRGGSLYAEWNGTLGKYVNKVEVGYSYNNLMASVSGFTKMTDFRHPARTGLQAEIASYNWYNRGFFTTGGYNTGFWFADRHKHGEYKYDSSGAINGVIRPGRGNVLFLDGHVAGIDTPYPNGQSPFLSNDYNLQNP